MTGHENFQSNDGVSNNNVVESTAKCLFADAYSGIKCGGRPSTNENEGSSIAQRMNESASNGDAPARNSNSHMVDDDSRNSTQSGGGTYEKPQWDKNEKNPPKEDWNKWEQKNPPRKGEDKMLEPGPKGFQKEFEGKGGVQKGPFTQDGGKGDIHKGPYQQDGKGQIDKGPGGKGQFEKMPYDPKMPKNEKFPNGKLGDEFEKKLPNGKSSDEFEKFPNGKMPEGKLDKLPNGEKGKFPPNKMEGLDKYPNNKMEGQLDKYPNKMEGQLGKYPNKMEGQLGDKMNRKGEGGGGGFKDGKHGDSFGNHLEKHGSGKSSLGEVDKNGDGTIDGTEKQFDKNGNDVLDEHEGLHGMANEAKRAAQAGSEASGGISKGKDFSKGTDSLKKELEGLNKKMEEFDKGGCPEFDTTPSGNSNHRVYPLNDSRGASGTLPSIREIAPDINTWSRIERGGSVERGAGGGSVGRRGYDAVPAEQTRRQYRNY